MPAPLSRLLLMFYCFGCVPVRVHGRLRDKSGGYTAVVVDKSAKDTTDASSHATPVGPDGGPESSPGGPDARDGGSPGGTVDAAKLGQDPSESQFQMINPIWDHPLPTPRNVTGPRSTAPAGSVGASGDGASGGGAVSQGGAGGVPLADGHRRSHTRQVTRIDFDGDVIDVSSDSSVDGDTGRVAVRATCTSLGSCACTFSCRLVIGSCCILVRVIVPPWSAVGLHAAAANKRGGVGREESVDGLGSLEAVSAATAARKPYHRRDGVGSAVDARMSRSLLQSADPILGPTLPPSRPRVPSGRGLIAGGPPAA